MIVASPCGEFTLAKNQASQLRRLAMLLTRVNLSVLPHKTE